MYRITFAVAMLLGLATAAQRYSQQTARFNQMPRYQPAAPQYDDEYDYYNEDDGEEEDYSPDSDYDQDYDYDQSYYGGSYYRPQQHMQAMVQLELANALTDEAWWEKGDAKKPDFFKNILNWTAPLGNKIFDKWQTNFQSSLKDFGGDDVKGLFKLIPKSMREKTAGIANLLADPLTKLGDKIQEDINKGINKQNVQVESEAEAQA